MESLRHYLIATLVILLSLAGVGHAQTTSMAARSLSLASPPNSTVPYASLTNPSLVPQINGTITYCSDCRQTTVCAAGGSGAVATLVNNAWQCGLGTTITGGTASVNPGTTGQIGGYLANGTTISPMTSIQSTNVNGVFNVQAYGADPTGVADSSAAINSTIAAACYGGEVVLPSGTYRITTGINATNCNGLKFGGTSGLTTDNNGQANTVKLICNTGATSACLDLSGDTGASIHDVTLNSVGASAPSQVGILQARTTVKAFSQQAHFHNVYLNMKSLGVAVHSGKGSIGIYNYGAEQTTYDTVSSLADTPLVLSSPNTLALTSHWATLVSGNQSNSGMTMVGKTQFISADVGPRIWCDGGCVDVDLGSTYLAVDTGLGTGAATTQAGILGGSLANWTWHSGRQEDNTNTTATVPYLMELQVGGQFIQSHFTGILNAVTSGAQTQGYVLLDTGAGSCPYLMDSTLQIWNSGSMSSPSSYIKEAGAGTCTGREIVASTLYFTELQPKVSSLTLAAGSGVSVRLIDGVTPASISLPAGSNWIVENSGTTAGFGPALQVSSITAAGSASAANFVGTGTPSVTGGSLGGAPNSTTGSISVATGGTVVLRPGFTCPGYVTGVVFDYAGGTPASTSHDATSYSFTGVTGHNYGYAGMSCG